MADDQNVQLPATGANPAAIAGLMPGAVSPVQPQPDQNAALIQSILAQSAMGQQAFQQQLQRAQGIGNIAQGALQQNLQAYPVQQVPPHYGLSQEPWMKMQPVMGQGAGGDIRNAIADMGRGVLEGFAATRPGQDIQSSIYGPRIAQYGEQQKQRAAAISGLQEQQKAEEEPIASAASLAYRPYMAAAGEQRAQADLQRAGSYAQYVAQTGDYRNALIDMKQQGLGIEEQANQIRMALGQMGINVQEERNKILMSLGSQKLTVDQAQFNAAVQNNDQGFFDQLMIGLGLRQPGQVVPGSTQPAAYTPPTPRTPTKSSALPAGAVPGTLNGKRGYVLDGKFHAE